MPVAKYRWDDITDNIVQETDGNGVVNVQYSQFPQKFGKVLSQRRDNVDSFYNYDGVGATRELIDSNQNTLNAYTYSAFGKTISKSGSTPNPFRFAGAYGYYYDDETSDIYVRRRAYGVEYARWLTPDSLRFVERTNRYLYARNNPLRHVDPSGLALDCWAKYKLCMDAAMDELRECVKLYPDRIETCKFNHFVRYKQCEAAYHACLRKERPKPENPNPVLVCFCVLSAVAISCADGPLPFGEAAAASVIICAFPPDPRLPGPPHIPKKEKQPYLLPVE